MYVSHTLQGVWPLHVAFDINIDFNHIVLNFKAYLYSYIMDKNKIETYVCVCFLLCRMIWRTWISQRTWMTLSLWTSWTTRLETR